jgi:hypothetical protein
MYHKAADVRTLLMFPLMAIGSALLFTKVSEWLDNGSLPAVQVTLDLAPDGSSLVLITRAASKPELTVSALAGDRGLAVMGRVETLADRLKFVPAAPLVRSQRYRADWLAENGSPQKIEFEFRLTSQEPPMVRFEPQAKLPANALKFYLHFSQPMEKGVFLERLRLLEADRKEVIGPFRETELWSPDGKRLTVWFHPGRQKTGVNLNEEEGPVLRENSKHTLVVAGSWRSTSGVALGGDVRFDFQVGPADHTMPKMETWQITAPKSGTREPLLLRFDEPLDPAMLASALSVHRGSESVPLQIEVDGLNLRAIPLQPWAAGGYGLRADPNLEDLAGNNLTKLFEVDLAEAPAVQSIITSRSFEIR